MAVGAVFTRNHKAVSTDTITDYASATLSGTYVQGGFQWQPLQIPGTAGSSPDGSSTVIDVVFRSPLGYMYPTTLTTSGLSVTATTKILTAANTELAAGALPETALTVVVVKTKK